MANNQLLIFIFSSLVGIKADTFVGNLSTLQHQVSGSVSIRDTETLIIHRFHYDGEGPGRDSDNTVYFYVVNASYPYSPEDAERGYKNSDGFKILLPFPYTGDFYEYEDGNAPDLRRYFKSLMTDQNALSPKGLNSI